MFGKQKLLVAAAIVICAATAASAAPAPTFTAQTTQQQKPSSCTITITQFPNGNPPGTAPSIWVEQDDSSGTMLWAFDYGGTITCSSQWAVAQQKAQSQQQLQLLNMVSCNITDNVSINNCP